MDDEYFVIGTEMGTFVKGQALPAGLDIPAGVAEGVIVESADEDGDWVEITLSGGYAISIPEGRISFVLEHSA